MAPEGFDLLYEEGPCLVVGKPGGVLTQGPPGIDSLELRVKQFLKQRDGKSGQVYLGVPHRLDRPVSGALILCKHVRAARRVAEQFQRREVAKTYYALVEGTVSPESETWSDFMRKIPEVAKAELIDSCHPEARQARPCRAPLRNLVPAILAIRPRHSVLLPASVARDNLCMDLRCSLVADVARTPDSDPL